MDEINRLNQLILIYEDALTKLDTLDPKTKNIAIVAIKKQILDYKMQINTIKNNLEIYDSIVNYGKK